MSNVIFVSEADYPDHSACFDLFNWAEYDDGTIIVNSRYCKDIDQWRHYQNINEWGFGHE